MNTNNLTTLTPVVRGLLAIHTQDPDQPYQAGLVTSIAPTESAPGPALQVALLEDSQDPEATRKQLRQAIEQYVQQNAKQPRQISLGQLGMLHVTDPPAAGSKPLDGKIALVTGAAGAIGFGVCQVLLENGCYLAATDLPGERLDNFAADLEKNAPGRVIGVGIDVTDEASTAAGLAEIVRHWGGVDIVVVNAGIAHVCQLKDMDLAAFTRLEKVNVEGTLLTLKHVGNLMIAQGIGGDIIIMSTKNVPNPGAGFGAYSATKAACHQLGRIASLELAEHGIRVNMVAPDAVFSQGDYKSGLWQEVGPGRMKARGLDEKGLEEYYQNRNLLKARVTGRHVANAVLFFASRLTPTTGATIPVDGGIPEATPR